jgi:hypothetical protein
MPHQFNFSTATDVLLGTLSSRLASVRHDERTRTHTHTHTHTCTHTLAHTCYVNIPHPAHPNASCHSNFLLVLDILTIHTWGDEDEDQGWRACGFFAGSHTRTNPHPRTESTDPTTLPLNGYLPVCPCNLSAYLPQVAITPRFSCPRTRQTLYHPTVWGYRPTVKSRAVSLFDP